MKKEIEHKTQNQNKIAHKLLTGSTIDKFPILLDDGKTIIFINDKSKEEETRLKYKLLGVNRSI